MIIVAGVKSSGVLMQINLLIFYNGLALAFIEYLILSCSIMIKLLRELNIKPEVNLVIRHFVDKPGKL